MKIDCNECPEMNCFIKLCSPESLKKINKFKIIEKQKSKQFVFFEGTPVRGMYIVNRGKVKVLNRGFNNKVFTIRIVANGEILGYRGLGQEDYSVSAVAIEDTVLCYFDTKLFNEILQEDINLTYRLMLFYSNELRIAESRMRNLAQMNVRDKVADTLIFVAKAFGEELGNSNEIIIKGNLTRADLAEITGIRTEQIIRELGEFKKENIISINDSKQIIINDLDFLYKIISNYSFDKNSTK